MYISRAIALPACLLAWLIALPSLLAQNAAALSGTVVDATGKPIPNAALTVRNESSGLTRRLTADPEGRFSAADLPTGDYTVEVSAPSFAESRRTAVKVGAGGPENITISMNVSELAQSITVEGTVSVAAETAPSQNTLDARSARSEISPEYIQNFASPIADYTELLNNAPGTFSVNPNGVGLGDSKTYFRGFKDGQYTMQADGIPFNDTNDPTHHSWAFFPSQFIAGADFDRSPGTASSIGPTNFGGTVDLLSRSVAYTPDIRVTASYGSFNTRLLSLDADSGQFGPGNKSSLTVNIHQMLSDGYETYNNQKRDAGFLKYQYRINDRTTVTVFGGLVDLWTNTPNLKGPTRAQIAEFGDNYLMTNDPTQPNYYAYNFYHVQTDFEYIGIHSELGRGWKFDNKLYTYRYWNKQNYNNPSIQSNGFFLPAAQSITATSGVDKLNGYRKVGDIAEVSYETTHGVFRTGLWFEWAYTDRYQTPSDPRTWQDSFLPNFHEHFITTSAQPFVEYEYNITRNLSLLAGIKVAEYGMDLTQFQDNGKTGVGCVGGVLSTPKVTQTTVCVGGAPSAYHEAQYRSWMPAASLRYKLKSNWTTYAQFGTGSNIPPSSVFDFAANGVAVNSQSSAITQVGVLPQPTTVKTYQVGTVLKFNRWTLDFDGYYSHFQNPYSTLIDPATGESYFYQTGPSNTKGIEAESNVLIGRGFSVYLNGTMGSAKYQEGPAYSNGGLWIANTPKNTEAIGLTYQKKNWDLGIFNKRVGPMYNDNGTINQAVNIDPFNITNAFINYTFKNESFFRGTKVKLAVNNLFDQHNIVGVVPFSTKGNLPSPGDALTLEPGRSVSLTMTFGYAPEK